MQVQATPHPPARTRPLAAVLDGPNADPFGPHEPASYAATARGGAAARASDAAIASRRARQRRTASPLATPAGHAVFTAPMDVPLAVHPSVTGVIRGVETRGPAPAGHAGYGRPAGRIVRHA